MPASEQNHMEDNSNGQNDKNTEEQEVDLNLLKAQTLSLPNSITTQQQQVTLLQNNSLMQDTLKLKCTKTQNSKEKETVFQLPAATVSINPNNKSKYETKIELESVLIANKAKEPLPKTLTDDNPSTDELNTKITDISDMTVINEMTLYHDVEREMAEQEDFEAPVENCNDIIINPVVTDFPNNTSLPVSKINLHSEGNDNACELYVSNERSVYSIDNESMLSKFDDVGSRYHTNVQDFPPLPNYLPGERRHSIFIPF